MQKARTQPQAANFMNDRVTDGVAVTMVASFWWLPSLEVWSQFAAMVSPIIGLLWLIVQILVKISEWHSKFMAWRIKREQAQHVALQMKRNQDYDDFVDRTKVAGRRSWIPGDEGDTWP